jgi:hypothetical protein
MAGGVYGVGGLPNRRPIEVLIPPDASKRKGARRGWEGGYYALMRSVLASERGADLYRRRQPMIEPVFGQTKFNRGIDRFRRRGRAAVRAEWRLITATHNLLRTHSRLRSPQAASGAPRPSAALSIHPHRRRRPPQTCATASRAGPPAASEE